jgi:protein-S-isoprenylcysteine O-methyltransferase Ste14
VNLMVLTLAILRRSPHKVGTSWQDIAFTLLGTYSSVFLIGTSAQEYAPLQLFGGIGVCFSIYGLFCLRHSFGLLPAHRGLVTHGAYNVVRHPVYAGYFISNSCFLIQNFSVWNMIFYAGFVIGEIVRMLREEKILSTDPEYSAYMQTTKYRIIPYVW